MLLAGNGVATVRSFIMLAVMLTAVMFDRAALTMRNLAIAALVILAIVPHEAAGPSFQMSFAATAALIAAYSYFARRRAARARARTGTVHPVIGAAKSVLQAIAALALTSLIAGTSTAIFSAYHFHNVATLGLLANLLAMPVISIVVMPMAVAGTLAVPFGMQAPFYAAMGYGLDLMMGIARAVEGWSGPGLTGSLSVPALALMSAGLVLLTIMQTRLRLGGVALLAAGAIAAQTGTAASIFVSEDGALVGVRTPAGLAVNRAKPNEFTLTVWQKAAGAPELIRPARDGSSGKKETGFVCEPPACVFRQAGHPAVVHLEGAFDRGRDSILSALRAWCGKDAIVIVRDATVPATCRDRATMVIGARELALRGSAAIAITSGGQNAASIQFSRPIADRPWTAYRRFGRAARGLAERRNPAPAQRDVEAPLSSDGSGRQGGLAP
jgi:competence protein ComEC